MYKTTRFIGICLIAAGLSACGGDSDYQPNAGQSPEQIFAEACASCHGEKGEGKFGFLLSVAGSDEPVEEIVGKIRQGGHMMPAFSQISEQEAAAVAGYLKNL
jgi:mono/diheme cytochrome c family protein